MRIHSNQHVLSDKGPDGVYSLEEWGARMGSHAAEDFERNVEKVRTLPEIYQNSPFTSITCPHCMTKLNLSVKEEGGEVDVWLKGEPCPYPQGMPAFDVELDIPSGVLIINEDLNALIPYWGQEREVYHPVAMKRQTESYAKKGLGYFFVTNHCSLFEWSKKSPQSWSLKEASESSKKPKIPSDTGFLCIMDEAHYLQRCEELGVDPWNTKRIQVTPGRWSFHCDYQTLHRSTFDRLPSVFLQSTYQGPCLNLKTEEDNFTYPSALEQSHFFATLKRLEDFPCEPISYLLTTLGNGFDWSFGQWSDSNVRRDPPFHRQTPSSIILDPTMLENIPVFDIQTQLNGSSIYPLSSHLSFVDTMPKGVDRYWLAIGLIFFKSIVENSDVLRQNAAWTLSNKNPAEGEKWFQSQLNCAKEALENLCQFTIQTERWDEIQHVFEELSIDFLPQLSHPSSPEIPVQNKARNSLSL